MILVPTMKYFDACFIDVPAIVTSDTAEGNFEKLANTQEELRQFVDQALEASITMSAKIYPALTTLGEMLQTIEHDTQYSSDPTICERHPFYKKIIAFGDLVVRYLLVKMASGESDWSYFVILREITGAIPNKPNHAGNFDAITNDWIEWGKDNGKLDQIAWDLLKSR